MLSVILSSLLSIAMFLICIELLYVCILYEPNTMAHSYFDCPSAPQAKSVEEIETQARIVYYTTILPLLEANTGALKEKDLPERAIELRHSDRIFCMLLAATADIAK